MGGVCSMHKKCEMHTKLWSENLKGNLGTDGLDSSGLQQGLVAGCEHKEHMDSIKGWEFLD